MISYNYIYSFTITCQIFEIYIKAKHIIINMIYTRFFPYIRCQQLPSRSRISCLLVNKNPSSDTIRSTDHSYLCTTSGNTQVSGQEFGYRTDQEMHIFLQRDASRFGQTPQLWLLMTSESLLDRGSLNMVQTSTKRLGKVPNFQS